MTTLVGGGGGAAASGRSGSAGSRRPASAGAGSSAGGGGGAPGSIIPGPPHGEGVSAEWFESFMFGDLPSFGNMQIMLWKAGPEATKEKEKEKEKEKKEERPRSSKGVAVAAAGDGIGSAGTMVASGLGAGDGSTTMSGTAVGTGTTSSGGGGVGESASGATTTANGGVGASNGPLSSFGGAKGTVFVGCVEVSLPNFRRGEWVEGWWPVYAHANAMGGNSLSTLSSLGLGMGAMGMGMGGMSGVGGVTGALVQIGEIKLKIKVDEEIILPSRAYKNVLDALEQRNYLDVLSDLETKLRIDHSLLSNHIVSLAVARNRLLRDIVQLAEREVANLSGSTNTLFRGNTVLTKTMETAMGWYGKSFLDASVGPIIRRMINENVEIEVDPSRLSSAGGGGFGSSSSKRPGTKDSFRPSTRDSYRPSTKESMIVIGGSKSVEYDSVQEQGIRLLEYWCNELWNHIYVVRTDCPVELRRLFGHIRMMVERRFGGADADADVPVPLPPRPGVPPHSTEMLPWQAISSFVFLRFLVPAILNPHLFGICPGMPSKGVVRSLTLLAKCTQSLANLNPGASQKEEYMRGIKGCLERNTVTMIDYLAFVSSVPDPFSPSANASSFLSGPDKHDRLHVINSLRERLTGAGNMIPTLYKDAIPLLPYALDVPKHLAILSSAVVRNARSGGGAAFMHAHRVEPGAANGDDGTGEWSLARFSSLCFDVEAQALKSVATLAQGAASAGAFGGTRTKRSTSVSSTWGTQQQPQPNGIHPSQSNQQLRSQQHLQPQQQQQATLASPVSGGSTSRGATPTGAPAPASSTNVSTTTPTQSSPSPWNTSAQSRRPTSVKSTSTPIVPQVSTPVTASSNRSHQWEGREVSKPSAMTASTMSGDGGKKKKSARPSTAPSAMSSTGPRPGGDEPFMQPDLSGRNRAMAPDASPSASFRYLPPDPSRQQEDGAGPDTPISPHGSSYGSRQAHGQGFQTIHRTESETYVAFHYPTSSSSSRFATVGATSSTGLKSSGPFIGGERKEKRERRSSFNRLRDMMKRPSTSSGHLSSATSPPSAYPGGHTWGEPEHSPHSSSGEDMSPMRSRPAAYSARRVDSIGNSSGEGYSASWKKEESGSGEPKKKRGIFGWLKK
ncbi:hypothetical protein FRC17_009654 [Serendipita sp. 399]|nr:hypothetical protein FRC17_009654 [Serendipita sp. 399]